jgi:hypothetical protein
VWVCNRYASLYEAALTDVTFLELREQIQEDDGLGSMLPRRDLIAVIEDAKVWSLWCIEAGETNIKSHMFVCLISAHIEALRNSSAKKDIPVLLVKAAKRAEENTLPVLQKMLEQSSPEPVVNELTKMPLDRAADAFEDWDFMVSDRTMLKRGRPVSNFRLRCRMLPSIPTTWIQ